MDNTGNKNWVVWGKFAPCKNKSIVLFEERTNERKSELILFHTVCFADAVMSVSHYLLIRDKK